MNVKFDRSQERGFTLIELVATLLILFILSAMVVSRGYDRSVDVSAAADVLKNHIRFAQASAMKFNKVWSAEANGSLFFVKNDAGTIINLPGEDSGAVDLNNKKVSMNMARLYFDGKGRPYTAYPNNPQTADLSVRVTATGGSPSPFKDIIITPDTGFIQ